MRKNFLTVTIILLAEIFLLPRLAAAEPTFVMLKFSDDTRFDALNGTTEDPCLQLSERILLKLVQAGKFSFMTLEPLTEDIEAQLYDEKVDDYNKFLSATNSGDYNEFFEDGSFDERKAQTIATAQVGKFISPEITAKIGADHDAQYLIHGTIINLGTGSWLNENLEFISGAVSQYLNVMSSYGSNVLGVLGNFGNLGIDMQTKGIGVQCDVRIIKAATGEVVWSKRVTGVAEQQLIGVGSVVFGHTNVSYSLYEKAINKAVDKIYDALIADAMAGKIF